MKIITIDRTQRTSSNIRQKVSGSLCSLPRKLTMVTPSGVSVSAHILANNALRAHYASAHGGLSANVLSDICLSFFEMILLSCLKFMFDGRALHSLAVVG